MQTAINTCSLVTINRVTTWRWRQ